MFLPALRGEFLNWDDSVNFVANPYYRGLGWPQIQWMLGATLMGHYIPVTWLSFGLNYALGGMNPWGYHLGNLVLHAANATLVYLIARRLLAAAQGGGSQRGRTAGPIVVAGAFAALVWGIHPLRVESVAWITERRDVLCGLFFLLAVLAYLKALDAGGRPRPIWRALSLAAFAAALLSKAAAMPLPAVLLLLDFYPLRRWDAGWKRLAIEKILYAVLAAATAVVALIALPRGAGVTSYESYGVAARIGMVAYSFIFYPVKFILPVRLSPMYELPGRVDLASWPFLPALLGVAWVTAALVLARARWPGGLAAWTYSALMVLPVSGVVHAGSQLVNDRYSYLSGIGFAVLAGAGVLGVLRLRERGRATMDHGLRARGRRGAHRPDAGLGLLDPGPGLARFGDALAVGGRDGPGLLALPREPGLRHHHGRAGTSPARRGRGAPAPGHRAAPRQPDPPLQPRHAPAGPDAVRRSGSGVPELPRAPAGIAGRPGAARPPLPAPGPPRGGGPAPAAAPGAACPPPAPGATGLPAQLATAIGLVEDDPGTLMLLGRALVEQGNPGDADLRPPARGRPGSRRPYPPTSGWSRPIRASAATTWPGKQMDLLRRLDPRAAAELPVR